MEYRSFMNSNQRTHLRILVGLSQALGSLSGYLTVLLRDLDEIEPESLLEAHNLLTDANSQIADGLALIESKEASYTECELFAPSDAQRTEWQEGHAQLSELLSSLPED